MTPGVVMAARRDGRSGLPTSSLELPSSPKMLNLRVIPPRTLLCLRTPLPPTVFRKQPRLQLRTQKLGCGRVERRHVSTSSSVDPTVTCAPPQPPPKSWVERAPKRIRPYLYLARVDKPIGTLLLYYPCSASSSSETGISES